MKSGREEITLVKVPVYTLFDIHVYPLFYSCVVATSKINSFYIVCYEVFSLFLNYCLIVKITNIHNFPMKQPLSFQTYSCQFMKEEFINH